MPAKFGAVPSLAQLAKSSLLHNRLLSVVFRMSRQSPFALREGLHGCTSLNRILSMQWPSPLRGYVYWSKSEEKKRKHYPRAS